VPIPLSPGSNNYKRDNEGNVVVTKLNESILSSIAAKTEGFYLRAGKSGAGLSELIARIDELEKETFSTKVFAEYEERYQIFLALGLFFLLLENVLSDRRNTWINSFRLFKE
jgi:Ca-activated chloride channel family protein